MSFRRRARTIKRFHRLYYNESQHTWSNTRWLGTSVLKCPFDLWMYQEILYDTRPDVVVETGTFNGGSAMYLAAILDILGVGEVLTIDVETRPHPTHPRVTYRAGSSTDPDTVAWVHTKVAGRRTMVILDSDHSEQHVAAELDAYASIVSPGCYLIVEDTNINGHPVQRRSGPGPAEALEAFLQGNDLFVVDHDRQRLMLTFNPGGYLLRTTL